MKLLVTRFHFSEECTIGRLSIDEGVQEFFTLEPTVREMRVKGKTAIPYGTYRVCVDFSERFKRNMPHILVVPNFEGVRIHVGNYPKDTEGCILVGKSWPGGDSIERSKEAFDDLFPRIKMAENVDLQIVRGS